MTKSSPEIHAQAII